MIFGFKTVDEKLKDFGFTVKEESKYGVSYTREIERFKYTQRLDIGHRSNGNHLIQSYQEGVNGDGFNNVVGLNYNETKLAMKKYRQLKRKYKWN